MELAAEDWGVRGEKNGASEREPKIFAVSGAMCQLNAKYPTHDCNENDNHMHYCADNDEILIGDVLGHMHVVIGYRDMLAFMVQIQTAKRPRDA